MLEETRLFKIMGKEISREALDIFDKADAYRVTKNQLDVITHQYNFIQKNLIFVERPLFYAQLSHVEDVLKAGIDNLTWKHATEEVDKYLQDINLPLGIFFR